ncbi:MAG: pyridoxamine 5'-phosphate oxidase family protein [Rhodoglobus sp.]
MDRAGLIAYVRSRGDAVVATLGAEGEPQAAYLSLAATDTGELVFDARPHSRKIVNLERDGRIAISVGGADGTTLQCEGVADLPAGAQLTRCTAAYLEQFPEFEQSMSEVVVVRVSVSWARYGDYRDGRHELENVELT